MAKFKFKSKKYYKKEIGIEYKKKGAIPQLWETSDEKHRKRAREFFGIR